MRMPVIGVVLLGTSLLTLATWGAPEKKAKVEGWPQWRGPNRDNVSAETGLNTDWKAQPPQLVWMAEGTGGGFASVSVGDGMIYTTGNFPDGQAVVALSEKDGHVVWKSAITSQVPQHGYDGSRCTPSIDGDHLYAISSDGKIACLARGDGAVVWSREFREWGGKMHSGWGFSESPLVDGDLVLCTPGGQQATIVALNKKTGKEVWTSATPSVGGSGGDGAGYSSIVISQGAGVKQYVQLTGRGVIGVRAKDGQFLWGYNRVANGTANIPTPIVAGDYVFCATGYGTGAALLKLSKANAGVKADEVYFLNGNIFQNHHGGMVLVGKHFYAGNGNNQGFPTCIEARTGKIVWGGKQRGEGGGSAAITCYDGHLIFRYQDGVVALIEATPAGYRVKGTLKPAHQERESWAHPVVANGKLYLREQNKLMCYDLAK